VTGSCKSRVFKHRDQVGIAHVSDDAECTAADNYSYPLGEGLRHAMRIRDCYTKL